MQTDRMFRCRPDRRFKDSFHERFIPLGEIFNHPFGNCHATIRGTFIGIPANAQNKKPVGEVGDSWESQNLLFATGYDLF